MDDPQEQARANLSRSVHRFGRFGLIVALAGIAVGLVGWVSVVGAGIVFWAGVILWMIARFIRGYYLED